MEEARKNSDGFGLIVASGMGALIIGKRIKLFRNAIRTVFANLDTPCDKQIPKRK